MAGISRYRWRKAWLDGVLAGVTGHGVCRLVTPKLINVFQRGVAFGKANPDAPYVKAALAARKPPPREKPPMRPARDAFRRRDRFDRRP